MTPPDDRVDNSARSDATRLVEEALRSGRIVQADHDMRLAQVRGAQSMQELDLVVRDLRAAPPAPPPTVTPVPPTPTGVVPPPTAPPPTVGAGAGQQPWPLVNYGPGHTPGSTEIATVVGKAGGRAIGGIIAVVVLVAVVLPIAGAAIAFFSARDSFPDFGDIGPTDETTYLPGQAPGDNGVNVHTVDGFEALVDALREEKGDTFTYTTVIYPRYAVLEVPTGVNQRYENYYWDGRTLELNASRGSSTEEQLDLSLVDPELLITMLETVRGRMDGADSWYVVISDYPDQQTQVSAYASNDFGESTYLIENLDGTVVYDSEAQ